MATLSDIEMARRHLAKVTRAEVRLRYSLMADTEINRVLDERLTYFDRMLQDGIVPELEMVLLGAGDRAAD